MPIGWAIIVVVLCVAVVILAVIVLGLLRQVTPVLERAATAATGPGHRTLGPAVGSALPRFAARGEGGEVTDQQLRGSPAVLLFLSIGCGPCRGLAEEMSQAELGGLASTLIVVTSPDGAQELGIPAGLRILTEHSREVSDPLSVTATPFAIAVDPDGIVKAVQVPNTISHLSELATALV